MKQFFLVLLSTLAAASLFASPTPTPVPFVLPHLEWPANPAGENVTSYRLYDHVGSTYFFWASIPSGTDPLKYFFAAGDFTNPHLFSITALNGAGESLHSNEVATPVAPTAPTLTLKP